MPHWCGGWDDYIEVAGFVVTFAIGAMKPLRDCAKCYAVLAYRKLRSK